MLKTLIQHACELNSNFFRKSLEPQGIGHVLHQSTFLNLFDLHLKSPGFYSRRFTPCYYHHLHYWSLKSHSSFTEQGQRSHSYSISSPLSPKVMNEVKGSINYINAYLIKFYLCLFLISYVPS